ncbi:MULTISPECIES: aliphatic sulfonate ABC transporter substrate-binding protein [unclassified Streptomyces]|uniref:aliphatic sulfonate ABC transporter substrate-binding protein n=1 Tax=unclassified Streptomyces TaxID=2593676 RepID=UPI002DD94E65|nr:MULTISPECIES: aliphatic sulfonate ABC transporter substrate-binding protein [unclassified Streptomyces]WSA90791.1 aliphatic sulfonate ABC transporter substrate-binding protein [Streptomyces sp. NBC_01795]WSB75113.1 aliphatic sulfonate ABC transporter substrate-binding protein [Streptomyces sp. NBC_01775]WSS45422.1 aliphatic sulfonate ABC transporter substrate-binding protein [Streptomyces sp. NBC_01187]
MPGSTIRRTVTALFSVTALTFAMNACSTGASGDDNTVNFGYIGDYNGASLLAIAQKQGLWKKQGLTAKTKVFNNGPVQIQALGSGDLDYGYIGPGAMWLPASGKAKVITLNTLTYADRVIGQPGIKTMKDLKGKRVGVPEGTSGDMILNIALEKAGMTTKDIQKIAMDPSTVVSSFTSGKIDGAGIFYPAIDTIKKKVPKTEEVASTKDTKDSFPTAFVAGNRVPEGKNKKVIKVLQQANDWRKKHPEESIALSAKMLHVSKAQAKADASHVETLSTDDLAAKTKSGEAGRWLKKLGDFFVRNKQLDKNPDPADYYTGDLYQKAHTG